MTRILKTEQLQTLQVVKPHLVWLSSELVCQK